MTKLSKREKVLMVILAVVVVIACWYLFIYTPLTERLNELSINKIAAEDAKYTAELIKAEYKTLKSEIEFLDTENTETMTEYDNSAQILDFLNNLLEDKSEYSIAFSQAQYDMNNENIMRRNVSMSYSCQSYDDMSETITLLNECRYQSMIKDLTYFINTETGFCSVSLTMTFYEYFEY